VLRPPEMTGAGVGWALWALGETGADTVAAGEGAGLFEGAAMAGWLAGRGGALGWMGAGMPSAPECKGWGTAEIPLGGR
jgi:hypothetical protein